MMVVNGADVPPDESESTNQSVIRWIVYQSAQGEKVSGACTQEQQGRLTLWENFKTTHANYFPHRDVKQEKPLHLCIHCGRGK